MRQRNLGAGCRSQHQCGYLLGRVARFFAILAGDVVLAVALVELRHCLSADGYFYQVRHVRHVQPVAGDGVAVHQYLQLGQGWLLVYIEVYGTRHFCQYGQHFFGNAAGFARLVSIYFHYQFAVRSGYLVHYSVNHWLAESHAEAGQRLVFGCQFFYQVFFRLSLRPLVVRLDADGNLEVRRGEGVGAVVVSSCLYGNVGHFGVLHRACPQCVGHLAGLLHRYARRQVYLQPDGTFVQRG